MQKINIAEIIERSKELKSSEKFNEESEKLSKLLTRLEKSKDLEINKILSEWIIIKLVILWEYHFKSLIIELIDYDELDYSEDIKLSISDLRKIQKTKEISAGKIFVSTKSFQNLETVNKIFSDLTKKPFLTELKNMYEHEIDVKTVKACLEKRHQIIHEMKSSQLTKSQVKKFAFAMMLFLVNSSSYTQLFSKQKKGQR